MSPGSDAIHVTIGDGGAAMAAPRYISSDAYV